LRCAALAELPAPGTDVLPAMNLGSTGERAVSRATS
jgi:hypothetical protein